MFIETKFFKLLIRYGDERFVTFQQNKICRRPFNLLDLIHKSVAVCRAYKQLLIGIVFIDVIEIGVWIAGDVNVIGH